MTTENTEAKKAELQTITEMLCTYSEQMKDNHLLEKDAEFMKEVNILLDEILKIKKELGVKVFNTIKYVLKEKYPSKRRSS